MFWFIVALILFGVCVAFFVSAKKIATSMKVSPKPTKITSGVLTGLVVIWIFFAMCLTSVSTRNVAVVTFGGHPNGYLTNGYHIKAPWEQTTELTDAIQTDTYASESYNGNKQGGATDTCIHVRVERQAVACFNASIRWQIRPHEVPYLFRNYQDNNKITDNLVLRDLQQAMNENLANYDPLGIDANGNNTNELLNAPNGTKNYSNDVAKQMRDEIGAWIDVQSVIIPLPLFDDDTQKRISQIQQQIAQTQIAIKQIDTAEKQREAYQKLIDVLANPGILTNKCLDILQEMVNKSQQVPAAFSCFGASSVPVAVSTGK